MKNTYFSVKPGAKGSEFYGGGNSQGLSDKGTKYQGTRDEGLSDQVLSDQVPSTNYRTTSVECPGNHPVITLLSPRNHPLLGSDGQVVTDRGEVLADRRGVLADRRGVLADRRGVVAMMRQKCMMWKYVAMLLAVLVLSVGNIGMAWGTAPITNGKSATAGASGTVTFEDWTSLSAEKTNYWKDGIKFWNWSSGTVDPDAANFTTAVGFGYYSDITAGSGWGSYSMSGLVGMANFALGISVTTPSVIEIIVDNNQNNDLTLANLSIYADNTAYEDNYDSNTFKSGTNIKSRAWITRVIDGKGRYKISIPVFASDLSSSNPYIVKLFEDNSSWSNPLFFVFESITVTPYIYLTDVKSSPESGPTASNSSLNYDNTIFSQAGFTKWGQTSGASGYYELAWSSALDLSGYTSLYADVWWGANSTSDRGIQLFVNNGSSLGSEQDNTKTILIHTKSLGAITSLSTLRIQGVSGGGNSVFFRVGIRGTAVASKDYTVTAVTSTGTDTYGTVVAEDEALDEDETTTITATPATGYQVTNWAVSGTGASISPSGASNSTTTTLTMGTENAIVTATFGPKSCTVTFDKEGGSRGSDNAMATYDSAMPTITAPKKTGYTFGGYWDGDNGTGTQYYEANGTSKTNWDKDVTATQTLYAKWTAKKYTINYRDQGDAEFSGCHHKEKPGKHIYGSETTLKPAFKDGYVFGGWYTSSDCLTGLVTIIGATDYTASFYLYAKWTAMSLDALEGGTLYTPSDMVPSGITVSSSSQYYPGVSANNRFNILGVGNGNTETGPLYSRTCTKTTIDDIDFTESLYSANASTITSSLPTDHALQFKISGDGLLDIYCYDPEEIYLIKAEGSAVQLDASGTGKAKITKTVSAGTYYIYTDDTDKVTRLYGLKFTPTYTVTLNTNGGTINAGNVTSYNYGTGATLPTDVTKSGYTFGGWYDNEELTGSAVTAIADNVTGNKTYWAKWTAAATLTAISADRLYQAAEMASNGSSWGTKSDTWFTGLSTYNLFKTYGDATGETKTAAKGKTITSVDVTDDLSTKSFTSHAFIEGSDVTSGTADPTYGAIEFITPSTAGILYVYITDGSSSNLKLRKKGTSTFTALASASNYKAVAVDASSNYYIHGNASKRGLYGIQYVSTYAVSITPTNVTKATGDTGAGAAIKGKAYTATFTANMGYTLPSDVTVSIGGTPQTKGSGYTWTISGSTATLTVPAAKVTGAIAVIVSGVAAATYTVTYNGSSADGGTVPTDGNSYTSGSTVTVLGNTGELTRIMDDAEATFLGWNTKSDTYSGTHYNAGDEFSITSNITLYAVWGFALEYNTDGGTINDVSYPSYYVSIYPNSGETTTLPSDVTKPGYTFDGWKTGNGSGSIVTTIDGEYTGSFSGDYALKAIWTPKTTTITLDKNNSDPGSMNGSATVTYGSKDLTITHATRTGYTQKGYRTAPSGGDMIIKDDGTLDGTHAGYTSSKIWAYDGETLTLYAQWEANKYDVTHTLSGGVSRSSGGEEGSKKATYGTGYSVVFAAASGYALPAAVTVTVGGSDVTANCTWNQGSGTLTIPAAYVTGDIVITVTGVLTCTDPGLGFENASLTKYTGESVSNTLTNTHSVAVTYSSSDEAVATVNSSGEVTIKGVGTTTITATAAAQTVSAVSYCADAASYDLTVNPYTITYNLNEGDWGEVSHKGTYTKFDDGYDLPTPTKTGYTFLGWYENSEFTGGRVYILPAGSTGNKTYYAKWGSAVTATWSVTKVDSKLYRGGGGHHVTAVLDQADWDESGGSADDLNLSASEGVTLKNIEKSINGSGKAQVEADFSISGDIDEDEISFFLNVPAAGEYAAAELSEEQTLNDCPIVVGSPIVISIFKGTSDGDDTKTRDAVKYKQDTKWTDATTGFASTAQGVKDLLFVFADNSWSSSDVIVGGTTYLRGIQNGGSDASSYYFKFEVPTGYTASFYVVYGKNGGSANFGLRTTASTPANDANSKWYATASTGSKLYGATISDIPSGTYYLVSSSGSSVFGEITVTLTPTSGVPGVPTTLSWSGSLADEETVDKNNVDADFAYTATPNTNTIGAITYTSSDESVATVDGNGKVHIIKKGETTITATLAESGCYTGDEITYTLKVKSTCEDVRGTIVAADGSAIAGNSIEKGACETVTLKLTGYTDGATIQWKKDGANISGATSAEYTVPTDGAGVYTAVTTKNCDLTSNSVTVTSANSTIEPTIFADEFTVKSYRPFEYRLMQLNEGETCTVKSATKWKNDHDFEITTEGNIVTIKGYKKIVSDDEETITLTISNGCSSEDKDIRILIHAIAESPKPMIAWIATGDKGVKDNVLADQSTNTNLYKALKATGEYALTPRNCYWTTDEKELIKEYSQYDLVILTDYPNSRKGPNSEDDRSKSYTNALGLLIDRVPMLTFEAFVAGCPNWGFSSNPENTSSTQNSLTLLCNANDIFAPSNDFNAGASVEVGTVAEGEGQQALQGFELDAMPNFVFIAKITDGGRDYVTCCERQVNTNARMMVFGLNQNLMNAITKTGEDMVAGFVKYLLLDETASIPDCSVIFKGTEGTGGTDWSSTGNWEGASLPNPYASVRIDAPCVVGDGETAKAGMIKIHTGSDGGYTYTGSLTIQPQGRMIVENGVYRVEGTNYATYLPTEPNNLVINADEDHTGALIFSNPGRNTQATVYLYSKATTSTNTCWQYVGIPFGSLSPAVSWFYNAWMMKYTTGTTTGDTELYSWEYINNYDVLNGFQGYALTQTAAKSYQLQGSLAPTTDKVLAVSNAGGKGWNLYANSWTAPIHIDKMEASDFVNADATIYLYNTGSRANWNGSALDETGTSTTAGQYLAVPVGLAEYTGTKYIPSMQGFFVQGNHASAAGSVRLRYDAVVRDTTVMADLNTPLRTPSRERVNQEPEHVTMVVRGEKYTDVLHLFRSDEWSAGYENGYDAHKVEGDDYTPQLYAVTGKEELAVVATDEWEGTVLNFRAGSEDVEYTIFFRYNESEAEALYLYDLTTETYTRIENGGSYHFSTTDKETPPRFILTYNAPSVATGTGDVQRDDVQSTKARKVLLDNHVYIFRNGKLYNSTGKMVK